MNKICRICLEEGVLSSIFTKNFNISLCDMIEYCCKVKITRDDGLPEQMCSNCMYKLGIAYHFKQSCESADLRLRQYLGLSLEKFNDVAVMTDPIVPARTTIIKRCKCKASLPKRSSSNYKRKPETEQIKRGPKPKPKQIHSCFECQKQFRCQAQLEMHERTHTGVKPFACMFCPRSFTQKHNLTIHLRMHTGEKPFQCDVCSKCFSAQGNLNAHLKIHTGQKDHVCSICNKSFITSSELTRHLNHHRDVKNFKCDLCQSAYKHSRDLKRHKMKKHQDSLTPKIQDNFNAGNIDIMGVDGKDAPEPMKDTSYLIPHLLGEKPSVSVPMPEHGLLAYEQRKDVAYEQRKDVAYEQRKEVAYEQRKEVAYEQRKEVAYEQRKEVAYEQRKDVAYEQRKDVAYEQRKDVAYEQRKDVVYEQRKDVAYEQRKDVAYEQRKEVAYEQRKDVAYEQRKDVAYEQRKDVAYEQRKDVAYEQRKDVAYEQRKDVAYEQRKDVAYEQRKDVFTHYPIASKSLHRCAVCSEGFDYVTALSQHYALRHEELNSIKHFMA